MPQLDTEKRILDLPTALSPGLLAQAVDCFAARYPALGCGELGRSMLDRPIHRLQLGRGTPCAVYLSGQSGGDAAASAVLTRFVNEYSEQLARRGRLYGVSIPYLAELRSIHAVPMLNPDGIGYALEGVPADHLLRGRLVAMNRGSGDFSGWRANARGVDLRCNYAADAKAFMRRKKAAMAGPCPGGGPEGWCGEAAESEPESSALGRWLRALPGAAMVLELRLGERRVVQPLAADRRMAGLGRMLGRLCDAPVAASDGGELCDWAAALGVPGFVVYCGEGGAVFDLYAGVREMLFLAPTLAGK